MAASFASFPGHHASAGNCCPDCPLAPDLYFLLLGVIGALLGSFPVRLDLGRGITGA